MSIDMSQFHDVFYEESHEHIHEMEVLLMNLDLSAPDSEDLNSIFRAAHSIKGGSGIFGFDALIDLTHLMESLLDKARKDQMVITDVIVDTLLSAVDILKSILDCYKSEQEIDYKQIDVGREALNVFLDGQDTAADVGEEFEGFGFFEPLPDEEDNTSTDDEGFGFFEPLDSPSKKVSETSQTGETIDESINELVEKSALSSTVSQPKAPAKKDATSLRVDTSKIDSLINLVGELVITQSRIKLAGEKVNNSSSEKLEEAIDELSRNIRNIQETAMSMRMLPMSFAFNRFPRVVRDLSSKLDKEVELVIEGGDTEIDKGLIEKLVDPLTHLVRNSIDHGIESPEKRLAAGKTKKGKIILKAEQRGGSIHISIIDDGAGLDRQMILNKAAENGLSVSHEISDSQVWNLIFSPGFSTAEQVTDVSGRGVGMDVVKRNIEGLGGLVDITSIPGKGANFNIRLPLTLAILDGMCISVGDQVFIIPLTHIIESIQPKPDYIKTLANEQLLWIRGAYWPILPLYRHMNIEQAEPDPTRAIVVLIESSEKKFGLLVDGLAGQQQVVIKSLEQHYKRIPGLAGATIMGDGSVAFILDVESLASEVNSSSVEGEVRIA